MDPPGGYETEGGDGGSQEGWGNEVPGGELNTSYDMGADGTNAIAGLGPDDDITSTLPAFANETNKNLHREILARQKALASVTSEAADHSERLAIMQEHLKNVRQELLHAQELTNAKQKELKTEEHLKALTERAVGRMRQEIASLDKRADGVAEQVATVQADIYRGSERLEAFREAMQMAQSDLEKWAAKAQAKEQDNLAIEKYTRGDELKIRDLIREQERLTLAVAERRKQLEKEVTETKAKQVELDKLAEDFRAMHSERQSLIRQWQDNLTLVQRRDLDIAKSAEHFARAKAAVQERRQKLHEQETIIARLQTENEEMEVKIGQKTRAVGLLRDDLTQTNERVNRFRDDVELLKTNVTAAASEVTQRRNTISSAVSNVKERERQIEHSRNMLEDVRSRLAHATAQVASTETALSERENYMEREQGRVDQAERRLALLKDQLFKANEAVKQLREQESILQAEIQGTKRTSRNLSDRIRELDAQSLAQQEHVYAAEFQIQQMERKIARALGEVSDEEKKILTARINELNAEHEEVIQLERGLQAQCKQVKEDLKQALRSQTDLTKRLAEVQSKIDEYLLQNRSAEETLRKVVKEKEEAMVSHDVLKLEIRKLRDALSIKTDEVYGLENRSAQLAMSVEARKREVEAERAIIRAQGKLIEEERHKLALDLTDRQAKIALLKTKYETLCARMPADEGGESRSQAYFILKAAQKREELQREGDELDAGIRKAEREVKALSATLGHLTARNSALRDAFRQVDLSSDEATSVRGLEQQFKDVSDGLFNKKKMLQSLQSQLEENMAKIAALDARATALGSQLDGLEVTEKKVEAERTSQAQAVESTKARVEAARMRHRVRQGSRAGSRGASRPSSAGGEPQQPTPDEVAYVAQGIRECNSSVLFTIGQLAREFTQLQPVLAASMTALGLKMPTRPPARVAGAPGGGAPAPSLPSRAPVVPTTPLVLSGADGRVATPSNNGLAGSLRRPASNSSLTGAARTIVATPGGKMASSPMGASIGSRPGSASSQHSMHSMRSTGSARGARVEAGGVDFGLTGTRMGAGTPTHARK